MAILKDLAQVLHIYEQGNTSLVVVLMGRRLGQFRVHIKGGRRWPKKGFEGGFDLLSRGEILVYPRSGETLWVFKEWDEHARANLGGSLALLHAASYLCELTEVLTRSTAGTSNDSPTELRSRAQLYELLAATSRALSEGARPGPLLFTYSLHALQIEGLLPALNSCRNCQKKLPAARPQQVRLTREGLSCAECAGKSADSERGIWLSPEAHRILLHLQSSTKPVQASPGAAKSLGMALILLVQGALERDLRTLQSAARLVYRDLGGSAARRKTQSSAAR